jgi:NAD(P)-dependent dehydrogenase (short-subunit alcohol dehydrogenase family)
MKNILITGTSKGIGESLAVEYLEQGQRVLGISRTENKKLKTYPEFRFLALDISDFEKVKLEIPKFLQSTSQLDLMILNAGILNEIKDMKDTSIEEIKKVMDVNVWSHKVLMDLCFEHTKTVKQVVAISSGAAVTGSRGWNAYSLSKAALNMLINLYAHEKTDTHFCAMAPGIIDTDMQEYISGLPDEKDYPVVRKLKKAKNTPQMPPPEKAAFELVNGFIKALKYESGSFLDIRNI